MRLSTLVVGACCLVGLPSQVIAQHSLDGVVQAPEPGLSLDGVIVTVQRPSRLTTTSPTGRFRLTDLPEGPIDITVRRVGYLPLVIDSVMVPRAEPLVIMLTALSVRPLDELLVRASPVQHSGLTSSYVLDNTELADQPFLGEDAYRTLTRVPGIAADELSARFRIRGAEQEEDLVRLDGMTLLDPFHLKDLSGTFSVVDAHWIERTTVTPGGFGAEYGNRTGGVVEFDSEEPGRHPGSLFASASPTHARLAAEGRWAGAKGGWRVSGRRGIPDLVLSATGHASAFSPRYMDGMVKVTFDPAPNHHLSGNVLAGADRLRVADDDDQVVSRSASTREYGWLRWQAAWGARFHTETVVSGTHLLPHRDVDYLPRFPGGVEERNSLMQWGLRSDARWRWRRSENGLRFGAEVQRGSATYDYAFTAPIKIQRGPSAPQEYADTGTASVAARGTDASAYLAPQVQPIRRLLLEPGVRLDYHSYAGRSIVSPRLRGTFDAGKGWQLRGAWGSYAQTKGLHELDVIGGERDWRTQRGEQQVAGLEWSASPALHVSIDGYRRLIRDPWPRRFNIEVGFEVIPESDQDDIRIAPARVRAEGVDAEVRGRAGRLAWRAGYTLARIEDHVDGRWTPRPYDQRHATTFDATLPLGTRWSLGAGWQWHSGWPTPIPHFDDYSIQGGRVIPTYSYNELGLERMPSYHRLDLRFGHQAPLAHGTLFVTVDVLNVYNHENLRGVYYDGTIAPDGGIQVKRSPLTLVPLVPVLGLGYRF